MTLGHAVEAERIFREALKRASDAGSMRGLAMSLGNLAVALHKQGRAGELKRFKWKPVTMWTVSTR